MKRILSFVMTMVLLVMCIAPVAQAASECTPYASKYFSSYSVSLDHDGNTLSANFAVFGTRILDRLGAKTIYFQRSSNNKSWTTVKTVSYTSMAELMKNSTTLHGTTVSYNATPGYYYRAYIVLWAEFNGDNEYRHLYTNSICL